MTLLSLMLESKSSAVLSAKVDAIRNMHSHRDNPVSYCSVRMWVLKASAYSILCNESVIRTLIQNSGAFYVVVGVTVALHQLHVIICNKT